MAYTNELPSEHIQQLLKTVYDSCAEEDQSVRERQLRRWRRLKLLWEGFNQVWFSEVAHDWRIWDLQQEEDDSDQSYYDKPVNIFKAYLESIIAALSVLVPPIKCFPDDADNTLDLATARAGDKIGQLIYRHNDVAILWLHMLFIFATEGMVAVYGYPKADEKYGTYTENKYKDEEEEHELTTCSNCGNIIDDQLVQSNSIQPSQPVNPLNNNQPIVSDASQMGIAQPQPNPTTYSIHDALIDAELDEFQPDDEDALLHSQLYEGKDLCPACMTMMDPEIKREKFIVTRLVGNTTLPKSRICLEAYGGMNVKIPNYAKTQAQLPYLSCSEEIDYTLLIEEYQHLHNNKNLIECLKSGNQPTGFNQYAAWARLNPQYASEYPRNVITRTHIWIRPAKFNILPSQEDIKLLKKKYPDGVKLTMINEELGAACNESLDDCWTLLSNPLSDYLHFEPSGEGLVSIQDITNDIISLTLQTIEHGIGQTFADSAVLDFNAYTQTEATPGGVYPVKAKTGKSVSESFHQVKTASLSPEVMPFAQNIQSLGQLASGALPSLFGGQLEGNETASGYSMSRAQALQRQQNTWKMFTLMWKNIFGKVIPMFIKEMKDDERDVMRDDDGNFINVLIRKAETEGKIGKVELEANENLPMTWSQTRDLVEKLLTNANPEVIKIISAPENIGLIHDHLGLVDFYVPGEDDIIKQYDEIKLLLNSEPIPTGDPQNPFAPSVDIDPIFDNHQIEFEICRKWIISEAGRQIKIDNENGYMNVLLHGKAHFNQIQINMMQQQQASMNQGANPKKPKETEQEAPILDEGDVNNATIQ